MEPSTEATKKRKKTKGRKRAMMSEEEKHELYNKIMSSCLALESLEKIQNTILNEIGAEDFNLTDVKTTTPLTTERTKLSLLQAILLQGKLNNTTEAATSTSKTALNNDTCNVAPKEEEVTPAQMLLQWLIDHNADANELITLPIDTLLLISSSSSSSVSLPQNMEEHPRVGQTRSVNEGNASGMNTSKSAMENKQKAIDVNVNVNTYNENNKYEEDEAEEREDQNKKDQGTLLHYVICANDNARLFQLLTLAGHKVYSKVDASSAFFSSVESESAKNVICSENINNTNAETESRRSSSSSSECNVNFVDANGATSSLQHKIIPHSLYNIIKTDMALAQKRADLRAQLYPTSKSNVSNSPGNNNSTSLLNDTGNKPPTRSNSIVNVSFTTSSKNNNNNNNSNSNSSRVRKSSAKSGREPLEGNNSSTAANVLRRRNSSSRSSRDDRRKRTTGTGAGAAGGAAGNAAMMQLQNENKLHEIDALELPELLLSLPVSDETELITRFNLWRTITNNDNDNAHQKKEMVLFNLEAETTLTHLTPLQLAYKLNNKIAVQLLSFYGAHNGIESSVNGVQTELAYAVSCGNVDYVRQLVETGAGVNDIDLHAISQDGRYSLIHYAVGHPRMLSFLTSYNNNMNITNNNTTTITTTATTNNKPQLSLGLSIDMTNAFGESALVSLIRHGAHRNAVNAIKETSSFTQVEQLQALPRCAVDNYILMPLPALSDSLGLLSTTKGNNVNSGSGNSKMRGVNSNTSNTGTGSVMRPKSFSHESSLSVAAPAATRKGNAINDINSTNTSTSVLTKPFHASENVTSSRH